jgi:hypothetical protein
MADLKAMNEDVLFGRIREAVDGARESLAEVEKKAIEDVRTAVQALRDMPPEAVELVQRAAVAFAREYDITLDPKLSDRLAVELVRMNVSGHCNEYECEEFDVVPFGEYPIREGRYRALFFLIPIDAKARGEGKSR